MRNLQFSILLLLIYYIVLIPAISFNVMGDWGGSDTPPYTSTCQLKIAKSMGMNSKIYNSSFTVALGDNFYDFGINSSNHFRFQKTFEEVFSSESLQHRFYVIAGNHDHRGNISAQIEYTSKSSRWYYPSMYYSDRIFVNNYSILLIFLDAIKFDKNINQIAWLKDQLTSSKDDWIVVFGHYPILAPGEHGPTPYLVNWLRPLLHSHGIASYFYGHEHSLQHSNDTRLNYFGVGAGNGIKYSQMNLDKLQTDSMKFYWPKEPIKSQDMGGYAIVTIDSASLLILRFFDQDGNKLYQYHITNPRITKQF